VLVNRKKTCRVGIFAGVNLLVIMALMQPCVHSSPCSVIFLSIAIVKLEYSLCVLFRRGLVMYNVIKVLHAIPLR
jgi:hypothetical protein